MTFQKKLEEYCMMDAIVTQYIWQKLQLPWYKRFWLRLRYGSRWAMKNYN